MSGVAGSLEVVEFRETLRGTVRAVACPPARDDERLFCALAAEAGAEGLGCVLEDLRIAVDVGAATPDDGCPGVVRGGRVTVAGRPPLTVERGAFALFPRVPGDGRRLRYALALRDPDGTPWQLHGTKLVVAEARGGRVRQAWAETTTLSVVLEPLSEEPPQESYCGVVRVHPTDFARQLASLRGEPGPGGGIRAVARLATVFGAALAEVYLRGGDTASAPGIEAAFND